MASAVASAAAAAPAPAQLSLSWLLASPQATRPVLPSVVTCHLLAQVLSLLHSPGPIPVCSSGPGSEQAVSSCAELSLSLLLWLMCCSWLSVESFRLLELEIGCFASDCGRAVPFHRVGEGSP